MNAREVFHAGLAATVDEKEGSASISVICVLFSEK
jgi:hypothetical protein